MFSTDRKKKTKQKASKVKCKRGRKRDESTTKWSIFLEYIPLKKKHLSFAGAHSQKNTKLYHNQPGET